MCGPVDKNVTGLHNYKDNLSFIYLKKRRDIALSRLRTPQTAFHQKIYSLNITK